MDSVSNSESGDPGSNPVNAIKPPVSETTHTFVVTMSGGSLTTSPTIPTGPSQDQPTPDDGRRSNWSKRRVQSNKTDEDESPNNYNTLRSYPSSKSFRKTISQKYYQHARTAISTKEMSDIAP